MARNAKSARQVNSKIRLETKHVPLALLTLHLLLERTIATATQGSPKQMENV